MQQRDEDLRLRWEAKLAQWDADQLVFCDESASSERTLDRKRGWAPKGLPCRVRWNTKRSKRWSILPAIALEGYIAYNIYHGGYNSERFNHFIRTKLLPRMNPYPGPRSVLILDNASCHRSQELKDMCNEAGVVLEFLPPYSPDFNPIEESFSALKAWVRRNRQLEEGFEDFGDFLELAVEDFMERKDAHGYFRSAGIGVISEDEDESDADEEM
jgi:transposase